MFLYIFIIIAFLFILFFTKSYKKKVILELNQKEHRLIRLYPMAMFLIDILFPKRNNLRNMKLEQQLRELYVSDKIEGIRYLYEVGKLATMLFALFMICLVGLLISASSTFHVSDYATILVRPTYGEGEKEVELSVNVEGESEESVVVKLEEQKLTEEEVEHTFEEVFHKLESEVLGDNKTFDEISKPLQLVTAVNGYPISVSWRLEDPEHINYNGDVMNDDLSEEGILTSITADLSYDEYEAEYTIPLRLVPPVKSTQRILQEQIQELIEQKNESTSGEVRLPEKIGNKKVKFRIPIENNDYIIPLLGICMIMLLAVQKEKNLEKQVKERREQMLSDYAEIVSKLTLLHGAGLTISMAWKRIVEDYHKNPLAVKRYAYEEMNLTLLKMRNGTPESEAYGDFGKRSNLHCYLKLGSLLEQNLIKGTKGLKDLLESEVRSAFEERKHLARKKGEEAGTKLLVPMFLLLLIVLIIMMIPAFLTMKV